MIEVSFLATQLFFIAAWLLVRVVVWIKQGYIDWKRELALLLVFANLAIIIRYIFFPRLFVNGHVAPMYINLTDTSAFKINLVPFINLFEYDSEHDALMNILGNIAIFIPTGILLPLLDKKLDRLWKVALVGFSIPLVIEFLQLFVVGRVSDIDDLILNTLGIAIGYVIYRAIMRMRKTHHHTKDA